MKRLVATAALLIASASLAQQQVIPPAEDVTVTLRPEPRVVRALPAARALRLTLTPLPPGALEPLPGGRPLSLTLTPLAPPSLRPLPHGSALLVTLNPQPAAQLAALPPGRIVRLSFAEPPDPAALAVVAAANLPAPQALSVTLVPPSSPLAALASASLPEPQPLSVTLVPPASPLAALASANLPSPQPLSVSLYAGESLMAPTTFAGLAPAMTLAPPAYTVQIVQAIARRGVNFFDRRDPAGQSPTLLAAAGGGASPCAPGPTSGGTFQSVIAGPYPRDIECHSLTVVSDPAGQGNVLGLGDFHMIFANPGATLSAAVNVNGGPNFATLTGPNTSTISITGATTAAQGAVPAGTPMRIDGTANPISPRLLNYTLTVCTAAGPVVYRRADGNCL